MAARKKPSRKALTRQADELASRIVRARGHCEMKVLAPELACAGQPQAAHIVGRSFRSTRWDLDNILASCAAHHMFFTHHPAAFYLALEKVWPGLLDMLWTRAQVPWDKQYPIAELALRIAQDGGA